MRSVAQAEPTHGSQFQILHGQFAGSKVFATAARGHSALVSDRIEVWHSEKNGVLVRILADAEGRRYVAVRDHGVTWLLFYLKDEAPPDGMRLLVGLARAITEAS